jgi:hypothetical protein
VSEKAVIAASEMYFQHFAYIEWRFPVQNNNCTITLMILFVFKKLNYAVHA